MPTNNSKQAFWVGIGGFFSYIVGIASSMILSRYFTKGDYGTYKQVMFVYNTLLSVFTLGLPKAYAYFLPKYELKYSNDIIHKITSIFFILGAIFSISLYLSSGIISSILKNQDLRLAIQLFAPTPLLLLPTLGIDGIFASFRKTQLSAVYTIVTRVLTVFLTVLPVLVFKGNYIHAIIGFDVASAIACIFALVLRNLPIRSIDHSKSDVTIKKIMDFSLPLMYASIWGMIIGSANQFFISRYFGNETFAVFSNGFMEMPFAGMISTAIGAVLLPRFSEKDKGEGMQDSVYNLWLTSLNKSAKIIFPILIYSVFFSKILMICLYGDQYEESSIYFQIKNISSLLYVIPFAPIMLAIGKTRQYANIHMVVAIIIVSSEYLGVKLFASPIAIAIISEICQAMKVILLMLIISKYAKKKIKDLVPSNNMLKVLLLCRLSSIPTCILFCYFQPNKFVALFLSGLIFCICYYLLSWLFGNSYRDIFLGLMPNLSKSRIISLIP